MTLFEDHPEIRVPPPLVRVRATVAYLGTHFSGFAPQAQPGVRTVGGAITDALTRVLGYPVELAIAGRTDRGVHARAQVVSFDVRAATDLVALAKSLNKLVGPEIVVSDLRDAPSDFHARFSATARRYRYRVLNRPTPDPFAAATTWHVPEPYPLDFRAMQAGCDPLIGSHDFASFCRRPDPEADLTRKVTEACWERDGDDLLSFWIEANAFCHQMVRSVVALLVEVGRGRRTAADVGFVLRARDRAAAPSPAPPQGLCLWEVRYEPPPAG